MKAIEQKSIENVNENRPSCLHKGEKLKFQLAKVGTIDDHDCDYLGDAIHLVCPMNRDFTKIFLTQELKRKMGKALCGKPYPSVYISLMISESGELTIKVSFIDDLVEKTPYMQRRGHTENADAILTQMVREHFAHELGYDVTNANKFVEKLISEYPNMSKYFIQL